MAPSKSEPRKARTKQGAPAAETLEKSAETGDGDTSALDEVAVYRKADLASPESPVLPLTGAVNASPREPQPVKIEQGDTAAAHEAHVLVNSEEKISERIELESGEKGLPTDVIARNQAEEAAQVESQRVDIGGDGIANRAATLQTDAELVIADQAREIRERRAREDKESSS